MRSTVNNIMYLEYYLSPSAEWRMILALYIPYSRSHRPL